jgi:hypothetical protein
MKALSVLGAFNRQLGVLQACRRSRPRRRSTCDIPGSEATNTTRNVVADETQEVRTTIQPWDKPGIPEETLPG